MKYNEEVKQKAGAGFLWKTLENLGSQGVQFIISIALARLLSPKEYGTIAIISIFINFANALVQNGFATALIQKEDADERDFSSVFCLNIILSILIYGIIYGTAGIIAHMYKDENLIRLIRYTAIVILPGGIISLYNAYISRKMEFQKLFIGTFVAAMVSGGISLLLAMKGYGIWALVYQQIVYYYTLMLVLIGITDWKPLHAIGLDVARLKGLFSFGSKILVASIIDNIFSNMHALVIGKVYTAESLGSYNRGEQFPKLIALNASSTLQSVMLPVMSAVQGNRRELKRVLQSSIKLSNYIILPLLFGLYAISKNLILVLLGSQWESAIVFVRLLCIGYAFWPLHICNLQAINAMGRSDMFLKLEIIKKVIGILSLVIGIRYGVIVMVALKVLTDFIASFINAAPNKELLGYSIYEMYKDILPSIAMSGGMAILIYILGEWMPVGVYAMLLQILAGMLLYVSVSLLCKDENFKILYSYTRENIFRHSLSKE